MMKLCAACITQVNNFAVNVYFHDPMAAVAEVEVTAKNLVSCAVALVNTNTTIYTTAGEDLAVVGVTTVNGTVYCAAHTPYTTDLIDRHDMVGLQDEYEVQISRTDGEPDGWTAVGLVGSDAKERERYARELYEMAHGAQRVRVVRVGDIMWDSAE